MSDALEKLRNRNCQQVFIIGGASVYKEALSLQNCNKILLTSVLNDFPDCDTFFPIIPADKFRLSSRSAVQEENSIRYRFCEYDAIPNDDSEFSSSSTPALALFLASASHQTAVEIINTESSVQPTANDETLQSSINIEEEQYLSLLRDIMANGTIRGDRTGTGTISKFGVTMRFNLRNNLFPLLTTKRVFWRGVAEELLWFIKGSTNANELADKNIRIWDGNASKEFLTKLGLGHRESGDLGPVYGFQWRHFGAKYDTMYSDYTNQGVDQLLDCINKIKTNPEDRRIVMSAWNPADLHLMALPPCHMFCQFYVANNELSCQMYQRSADMGLGVPFNIASYALLTRLMAQVCGLQPGEFIHCIGDAHVYLNHIEALNEQVKRLPKEFPVLLINPEVKDIDSFKFSDFTIENYNPDTAIKMKMAV
jgi:dihydrofolate reductase/thymidylate synthase